jgi:hypothetical protein
MDDVQELREFLDFVYDDCCSRSLRFHNLAEALRFGGVSPENLRIKEIEKKGFRMMMFEPG